MANSEERGGGEERGEGQELGKGYRITWWGGDGGSWWGFEVFNLKLQTFLFVEEGELSLGEETLPRFSQSNRR